MGNLNPYYNESFVFLVEQEQLRVIFKLSCLNNLQTAMKCNLIKKIWTGLIKLVYGSSLQAAMKIYLDKQ